MNSPVQTVLRIVDRLGLRIALLLAVALLPLMIVSIVRSQSVVNESEARSQAALTGETLRAISGQVALIEEARGAALTLSAAVPYILGDLEKCREVMRRLERDNQFSFAGFVDVEGNSACSSADAPISFGVTPELQNLLTDPRVLTRVNEDAPISGTSVIYTMAPVYDVANVLIGASVVSVTQQALETKRDLSARGITFMTMNSAGAVLTSSNAQDVAHETLPVGRDVARMLANATAFSAKARNGQQRTYAIVPFVADELYAMGSWTAAPNVGGRFYLDNPALFPALMWFASLCVAWFAAEILVTRYVRILRGSMTSFADRRRAIDLDTLEGAPQEIRDVARAYLEMTDTIVRDEASLENALHQKEILLREVHHRVKNNLQLIASIMNMQMRRSSSDEVKGLLRSLHDRVMSLATIHKDLYQTSGLTDVHADELLEEIVRQIVNMGVSKETEPRIVTDFDELRLTPDQAVPLSLLVTEAVTNALKYIGSDGDEKPVLTVSLKVISEQKAKIEIANSIPTKGEPLYKGQSSGLGTQLLTAFSQQLRGDITQSKSDGWYRYSVIFNILAFDPENTAE